MACASVPLALEGFKRLGRATYIHEPTSTLPILISSWLDAQPRHIAKYTSHYQKLYPHARILLISTSLPEVSWRAYYSYVHESRRPVIEFLLALPKDTKILLYAFSNGGAITATAIAREYALRSGQPRPIKAKVLDSTPGGNNWNRAIKAFSMGLPKHPGWRILSSLFIQAFMGIYVTFNWVLRRKDRVMRMRAYLNDSNIFDGGAKRLYIFSMADTMIFHGDVKDHI